MLKRGIILASLETQRKIPADNLRCFLGTSPLPQLPKCFDSRRSKLRGRESFPRAQSANIARRTTVTARIARTLYCVTYSRVLFLQCTPVCDLSNAFADETVPERLKSCRYHVLPLPSLTKEMSFCRRFIVGIKGTFYSTNLAQTRLMFRCQKPSSHLCGGVERCTVHVYVTYDPRVVYKRR